MTATAERDEKWTERHLLDRLRTRHAGIAGNGPEWAYMEHVRDGAGFSATRTIDALALHLWPSRKHETHAFEVKVSHADFRRELADDCAKSAPWRSWVEYFWIVAPHASVAPTAELPDGWGLLVCHGSVLRAAVKPARLRTRPYGYVAAPDLPRSIVAAMLRARTRGTA